MDIPFPVIDNIKARRSVRTFDPRPLKDEALQAIRDFIPRLDNPFKKKGISIGIAQKAEPKDGVKLGTYGVIKGASTFLGLMTPPDPDSVLMAGYEFETLILYLTSMDLGTVWLGGTFKSSDFAQAMSLPQGSILPAVSPVGYIEDKRFVERMFRAIAGSNTRKPWSQLFFNADFSTELTREQAGKYDVVLDMVRLAPSATNTQPWRIVKDGSKYHFYGDFKPREGKLETNMRYLDMGIALCHFDLTARQLGLNGLITKLSEAPIATDKYVYIASWVD